MAGVNYISLNTVKLIAFQTKNLSHLFNQLNTKPTLHLTRKQ